MSIFEKLFGVFFHFWVKLGLFETPFNQESHSSAGTQSPSPNGTTANSTLESTPDAQLGKLRQALITEPATLPGSNLDPPNTEANHPTRDHNPDLENSNQAEQNSADPVHGQSPIVSSGVDMAQALQDRVQEAQRPRCNTEILCKKLKCARIETPPESHNFFVPNSKKNEIITEHVVREEILANTPGMTAEEALKHAEIVCAKAKNLFAILAYMGKGAEVCAFLKEEISDADLPFERSKHEDRKCTFSLQLSNGKKVEVMETWESIERESFGKEQWLMIAPVFKDKEHYTLHKNIVLPFISDGEKRVHRGGYGEVSFAQIHTSHYRNSRDQHLNVAVKKLATRNRKEFENERDILRKLGSKPNPHSHLVKLLASFEIGGEFFLIFPRANCNLSTYWEENPSPAFDCETVMWSLKQMVGIAQALNIVHNFKVTHPLDHRGKDPTPQKGVKLSVTPKEAPYGRHGDIKSENIIFFGPETGHTVDPRGVLQITDFGLGRFHGRDSKTEQWPHHVVGSPTYEPPECKLFRPVSRVYDLWSLGCLYLEFATWLLMGHGAIDGFAVCRMEQSSEFPSMQDDLFFTIIKDEINKNIPLDAKIRRGVEKWVSELHQHERCSDFIHQLLDLVMSDLLRIDATDRVPTSYLCVRFQKFLETALVNEHWLCAGNPRRPVDATTAAAVPRAMSESGINLVDNALKPSVLSLKPLKKVAFSEPEDLGQASKVHQPASPSSTLVPRKNILKKQKAHTWPSYPMPA